MTGGDTHHYTNEDGGIHPGDRPLSACLPTPTPALDALPYTGVRHVPHPTRPQTNRVSPHSSPPALHSEWTRDPGRAALNTPSAPLPTACQAEIPLGGETREGKRGCEQEDGRSGWAEADDGGVGRGGERSGREGTGRLEGGGGGGGGARGWPDRRRPLGAEPGMCEGGGRAGWAAAAAAARRPVGWPSSRSAGPGARPVPCAPTQPPASTSVRAGSQPGERRRAQARRQDGRAV